MSIPDEIYEAAARLWHDKDFQKITGYLNDTARELALSAMEQNDLADINRIQGRVRMLSELFHLFSKSRSIIEKKMKPRARKNYSII